VNVNENESVNVEVGVLMHTLAALSPRRASGLTLVLASLCASCEARPAKPTGPLVRDSAGILIVENENTSALDTVSWLADTAAAVRIGALEGDGPDVFGRVAGVARLSDGRIVVADGLAHEIRFFASDGSFLMRTGRRGSGPGEYEYFSGLLGLPGDSLLVIDHEGNRLTVLSPTGAYVRSFRFRSHTGEVPRSDPPGVRGIFGDGTLLVGEYLNACREERMNGGVCQDSMRYTRDTQAGGRVADFGAQMYYRQEIIHLPGGRNGAFSDPRAQGFWSMHGDRFYTADAERFEIRVHGRSGQVERIVRLAAEAVPVPRSHRTPVLTKATTEQERQLNADIAEAYTRRTWPEYLPAFSELVVDRIGNLWVREYSRPRTDPPARWLVFDSTGTLHRALRLPPLTIVPHFVFRWRGEIGADYVLGVMRDSDGVESVWVVPVRKL
jgi:6-bladed beta-propeller protein